MGELSTLPQPLDRTVDSSAFEQILRLRGPLEEVAERENRSSSALLGMESELAPRPPSLQMLRGLRMARAGSTALAASPSLSESQPSRSRTVDGLRRIPNPDCLLRS